MYTYNLFPQVPLGILLKDENKLDEMVSILEHLHQYIPTVCREKKVDVPDSKQQETLQVDNFHHILLGGDQLTVACSQGAQKFGQIQNRLLHVYRGLYQSSKIGMQSSALWG